ncbi:MAG: hypothetical protein JSR45_09185 [Proteobacteria bacterium]|nr:hypothetical protein [Pseudomonadota bacterium]
MEVSYFSAASLLALAIFLLVMIPRALWHLAQSLLGGLFGHRPERDPWLVVIAVAFLLCAGLGVVSGVFNDTAQSLVHDRELVVLSFLFFAAPAVLQVMRAWSASHTKKVVVLSHAMVALAILSLPASMAIPTAALMQAHVLPTAAAPGPDQAAAAPAAPADNPAAAIADAGFFTDNEVANDPVDYPIATWMRANLTFQRQMPNIDGERGRNFFREIPTYTGFWFDQTTNALSFEATDTFGVIVSRITHVRANLGFSAMVFLYKLLCALVLVAVTWSSLIRPIFHRADRMAS